MIETKSRKRKWFLLLCSVPLLALALVGFSRTSKTQYSALEEQKSNKCGELCKLKHLIYSTKKKLDDRADQELRTLVSKLKCGREG